MGKLVLLMKITSWENKWTVNGSHKSCIPVFFCVLELDESCWVWIIFLSVSLCFAPLPGLWAALSLYERNNLKWRNTSMSPFPPSPPRVIIQLIFFFPPLVPAIGAVITIYLGSLFHYSRAAVKPEEKCYVLWFMEAIWPVLIRGIYRTWCWLRK